jgi:hypothetical protein
MNLCIPILIEIKDWIRIEGKQTCIFFLLPTASSFLITSLSGWEGGMHMAGGGMHRGGGGMHVHPVHPPWVRHWLVLIIWIRIRPSILKPNTSFNVGQLWYFKLFSQAVRSQAVPTTQIPTDEKFKIYGKKQPKPPKSVVVAASKKMRRM